MKDSKPINDLRAGDWVTVPDPTFESRKLKATGKVTLVAPPYCKVLVRYCRERKPKIRAYKIANDQLQIIFLTTKALLLLKHQMRINIYS